MELISKCACNSEKPLHGLQVSSIILQSKWSQLNAYPAISQFTNSIEFWGSRVLLIDSCYMHNEGLNNSPEYEYKKNKKRKKDGNIVHCAQHDKQLAPQLRHEAHQLEDTQQPKCTENWQTRTLSCLLVHHLCGAGVALIHFHHTVRTNHYNSLWQKLTKNIYSK